MSHEARRRLEDLLDREIEVARLLSTTLSAERSALTGEAPEAVQRKTAEKIELLGTIERLESERRALCADTTHAAEFAVATTVADRWRALLELMAGCRAANEVNGYIIHVRQNQIRQLLDLIRGATTVTYGPHGKTFGKALRALARA
jgi:flagellar biosynthesis/type III secretory pathway chaperone